MDFARHSFVVSSVILLMFVPLAVSRAAVEPLAWADVERVAGAAFDQGRGAAAQKRIRGIDAAAESVSGRVTGLDLGLHLDVPLHGSDESLGETALEAMIGVELGRRAASERDALVAERRAAQAEREAGRLLFVDGVRVAWLRWWTAHAMQVHIEEHLSSFREDIEPLRAAVKRGELTRLDLLDLEVEEARVEVEVARQRRKAEERAVALGSMLARSVKPVDDLVLDHDADPRTDGEPWAPVLARIDAHPELRVLVARAEAARAAADAADAAQPFELSAGLTGRRERDGVYAAGVGLGLHIPFGNPSAPERERHRGAAHAIDAEHAWRLMKLRAQVDGAGRRYAAGLAFWTELTEGLEARLRARSELTESALRRGHVSLERLIRARRDAIEALHEKLEVTTELLADRSRAEAMLRWLESSPAASSAE